VIPDTVDEIRVTDTGECTFGAEWHQNLSIESCRPAEVPLETGTTKIKGKRPHPVQIEPFVTLELGARILGSWNGSCHDEKPFSIRFVFTLTVLSWYATRHSALEGDFSELRSSELGGNVSLKFCR
jgi:hypothetical protein